MKKQGRKKSFVDCTIWWDLPVNAAIFAYCVGSIIRASQIGIDKVLARGLEVSGSDEWNTMLTYSIPIVVVLATMSMVVEVIYLILKIRQKEPFITEKYAVLSVFWKIVWAIFMIATAVVFR